MTLIETNLPVIAGKYGERIVRLTKQELKESRLVRGKEYPLGLNLEIISSSGQSLDTKVYGEDINSFFQDLGKSRVILKLITHHGLVIIQKLKSVDPAVYSDIVHNIFEPLNFQEFDQVGLLAGREKIKEAVSSVGIDDELGKNVNKLNAHQEFSRYLEYPHILTFFAHKAPSIGGGESTTTHATELFDKINEKYPEFIQDLFEKNGNYLFQTFNYKVSQDSKYKISWTDKNAFGRYITQDEIDREDIESMKKKALKIANERVSDHVEFDLENNLILHQRNNIVEVHPNTGYPIIFSSLPTYYAGYYNAKKRQDEHTEKPTPPALTYGNGEKIPDKYLDYLFEQSIELEYTHKFEDGDILLLDNFSVYHGRNPYTAGDRTILASFWEENSKNKKKPYKPMLFSAFS